MAKFSTCVDVVLVGIAVWCIFKPHPRPSWALSSSIGGREVFRVVVTNGTRVLVPTWSGIYGSSDYGTFGSATQTVVTQVWCSGSWSPSPSSSSTP